MLQCEVFEARVLSSLAKVFADEDLRTPQWSKGSMLRNEVYSFQVAYCWKDGRSSAAKVKVNSELAPWISFYSVGLIPSEMPTYADHDEFILRDKPGLYPDSLMPVRPEGVPLVYGQWRSVWFNVDPDNKAKPGEYSIEIIFEDQTGALLDKVEFQLEVLDALLPKQTLIYTNWFHTDCLSTWYGVEAFSEEHWRRIEQYVKTAAEHGMNMILTPVFTPPLDTAVGGERPTVQLVDVIKSGETYKFGFDKLKRWVDLCLANGIEYFEISHLFTQWGAKHAPKIMANVNGKMERIFGWETDAAGEDYKNFLSQFLPELVDFIRKNGIEKRTYFHVSDEPHLDHLENYRKASSIIKEYVKDFPVIDALSSYEFYETGVVKNPIPSNNHIEPFIENNVPDLWTYYCCGQYKLVSNRFMNMPSARNRIIGVQWYKFNIKGFLQWGYNFWHSQYSRYPIDPWRVTDAAYAFPSGDAFMVYPSEDGPIESLRLDVFYEAIQDLRALNKLEELIGRDAVLKVLEEGLEKPITFSEYPREDEWILNKREQINRMIAEHSKCCKCNCCC